MKAKGLISYYIDQEAPTKEESKVESKPIKASEDPTETLKLLRSEIKTSSTDLESKVLKLEDTLLSKLSLVDSLISNLEQKLAALNSPTSVYRVEASNTVSMSRSSYEPVNGTEISVPFSSTWLVLVEIGVYSPLASKGQIALGRTGSDANDKVYSTSERNWVRTQDLVTSVFSSVSTSLNEGDKLSIYWKATEGVIRGTYRSITLISM